MVLLKFLQSINRIRLEFKGNTIPMAHIVQPVLIESDWNLKKAVMASVTISETVLIESDWNLKIRRLLPNNLPLSY